MKYRLKIATLRVGPGYGKRVAFTIPENTVVKLVGDSAGPDQLVDVVWNEKIVAIFAQDLRERGELIKD